MFNLLQIFNSLNTVLHLHNLSYTNTHTDTFNWTLDLCLNEFHFQKLRTIKFIFTTTPKHAHS